VGKWHMGSLPKYGPLKSGYDEFWGIYGGGVDYFGHDFGGNPDLWDGETPIEKVGYMTELIADRTLTALERRKADGRPFFISMHFTAPHWPWEGNDAEGLAESERIASNPSEGGGGIFHYDGGNLATYARMVKSLDDNIGRVLAKLAELGLARDTIVVFTSDNGGERFSDTWPFTGKKTELLEGGLRIPAIVRWPGVVQPGSRSTAPTMSMDWLPTFLTVAGGSVDPEYPSDGVDIGPALTGGALAERSLFWRYRNRDQRAHRRGNYKYLKINDNEFLFDVVADPLERANLKARQPERFAAMKAAWEQWDAGMLHDPSAQSGGNLPANWADHFNSLPPSPPPAD
jgi:arylsulfatase A-like enzyme